MKALIAVALTSSCFLSPVYAVDFLLQGETGLLMPQKELGDYYQPSFAYGGALQVSFPGPSRLALGFRAELPQGSPSSGPPVRHSSPRNRQRTAGTASYGKLLQTSVKIVSCWKSIAVGPRMTLVERRQAWSAGGASHAPFPLWSA